MEIGIPPKTLGVILARGGSQGLPRKHLLSLLGRPVITYTFDHARAAQRLTHTVVSSDCPEILALAADHGFPTLLRPPELATSEASVQDVLLHAMDHAERTMINGQRFDAVLTLYGNCPVRPAGCIDTAIEVLLTSPADSIRSFTPVGKWHPQWMAILRDGHVAPLHAGSVHRRQDLTPLHLHDGAVVASTRAIMEHARKHRDNPHAFFGTDRRGFETPQGSTVEIDHRRDLYWAEAVLRDQAEQNKSPLRAAV